MNIYWIIVFCLIGIIGIFSVGIYCSALNIKKILTFCTHLGDPAGKGVLTIDEAITHAKEVASRSSTCKACAQDHIQLASWLESVKEAQKILTQTLVYLEDETKVRKSVLEKNIDTWLSQFPKLENNDDSNTGY